MPKIEQLKKKYPGEWLAIEIEEEDSSGPISGNLISHNLDHDKIWEEIARDEGRIYVTYAGPPIEKGYAAAF
jgi:hypothetical protein